MSTAARVFLLFSFGYFVSYLFRGLNIGFAAPMTQELGLTAADLGLLTSLYFLGFSLVQIPAGAALDTWGPRRVEAALLLIAALGALLFGLSDGMSGLMMGRILIGVGVAVCLGGAVQAMAQNFPRSRLPAINGVLVALGGLGGAMVGTPLTALLQVITWREASFAMAGVCLLTSVTLWAWATDAPIVKQQKRRPDLVGQFRGTWQLCTSGAFWQITLFPALTGGVFYGVQSLWVKPYLMDVNQLSLASADGLVSLLGLSAVAGCAACGVAARYIERAGISLYNFCGLCLVLFLATQFMIVVDAPVPRVVLWFLYGFVGNSAILTFAVLAGSFPASMLGRATTFFNMTLFFFIFIFQVAIGWILELWAPVAPGVYPAAAHQAGWWSLLIIQALSAVWYFWPVKIQVALGERA